MDIALPYPVASKTNIMVANSDTVSANTDRTLNKTTPVKPAAALPVVDIDDPQYPHYQEDVKYPPIEEFEHVDRAHNADPKKAALLGAATEIIELTPHIGEYKLEAFSKANDHFINILQFST